ncbi:hypothetical protein QBC43DRAFT_205111 [Cladorrhinum sp. PSN259]|nr:hypothetical protein QBC43DRAFT_205111 [Cladorrhinum sp. PSN259]
MPRFQKPGSSSKEGFEKINVEESAGTPKPATLQNPVETARPVRVVAPETRATPRIVDTSSKKYKQAERQWVSVIVALPILFVTSYFLFDRLALGHVPPSLPGTAPKTTESEPRPEQKPEGPA